MVQHRYSVDFLYWCKRNKCTLVVLVLVLVGMKKRTRVGGGRVLVLDVLVLKSKGRRW